MTRCVDIPPVLVPPRVTPPFVVQVADVELFLDCGADEVWGKPLKMEKFNAAMAALAT